LLFPTYFFPLFFEKELLFGRETFLLFFISLLLLVNDTEEKDFSSSYFLGAFLIGFLCLPIGLNFDLAFFLP